MLAAERKQNPAAIASEIASKLKKVGFKPQGNLDKGIKDTISHLEVLRQ